MDANPNPDNKIVTIFGGTGFIGRHIVRRLAKAGYTVKVATRYPESAYFLRPYGKIGQVVPFPCDYRDDASIAAAVAQAGTVINCVGILFEKRKSRFATVHVELARRIAGAARAAGVSRLVHISAIARGKSKYAVSKRDGEDAVRAAFPDATILRPSVVFGPEDRFFNRFARLAMLPIVLPLIGGGKTRMQPVFVGDVAAAALASLERDATGRIYELGGPEIVNFRDIYGIISAAINRRRPLLTIPFGLAKFKGALLSLLPTPPLTADQVETLKSDSVVDPAALGLAALGITPTGMSLIVPDYLAPYRAGGAFPARAAYDKPPRRLLPMILLLALLPLAAANAQAGGGEGIAAIVNNDAITTSDLDARERLTIASSGLEDTPDVRQKVRPETLTTLIDERLMMQEAKRDDVKVTPAEIDKGFDTLGKQNGLNGDQFKQMLAQSNIPQTTLSNEIEAQTAWGKVIQVKIRPTVDVTDGEIDDGIAKLRADIGKTQYLVAEIYLPVQTPADDANVHQLAARLVTEMHDNHVPFQKVAEQFSQAPGSARGGDMGWVQDNEVPAELGTALAQMNEGELSPPIRAGGGYTIILLRKKQALTEQTLPSREDVREKLGLDKLDRAQRHLLQELRASAFIEKRG